MVPMAIITPIYGDNGLNSDNDANGDNGENRSNGDSCNIGANGDNDDLTWKQ